MTVPGNMANDPRTAEWLHFSVGQPAGPRSAIWRLWTSHAGDVYLAALPIAKDLKVSLHKSGRSRLAFTAEHVARPDSLVQFGQDRARFKWDTPRVPPGQVSTAFRIVVPGLDVTSPAGDNFELDDIRWLPKPPSDSAVWITLAFVPRGESPDDLAPGQVHGNKTVVGRLELATGVTAWIVAVTEQLSDSYERFLDQARQRLRAAHDRVPTDVAAKFPISDQIRTITFAHEPDGVPLHLDLALFPDHPS